MTRWCAHVAAEQSCLCLDKRPETMATAVMSRWTRPPPRGSRKKEDCRPWKRRKRCANDEERRSIVSTPPTAAAKATAARGAELLTVEIAVGEGVAGDPHWMQGFL